MTDYDKLLRKKVEDFLGYGIKTAGDANKLVHSLYRIPGTMLSAQTIRRYWNLVRDVKQVGVDTKNVLSKYVGYKSFEDFSKNIINDEAKKEQVDFSLINQLFNQNNAPIEYNDWVGAMMQVLVQHIFSSKAVFELFVEKLHHNTGAVHFVIAYYQCYHLFHEDWYIQGMKKCCEASTILHHKVYALSMEGVRALFQNDDVTLSQKLKDIEQLLPESRKRDGFQFPLEGAIFGLRIAADRKKNKADTTDIDDTVIVAIYKEVDDIIKHHKKHLTEGYLDYKAMIRTLIEVLCWSGNYNDANYFLNEHYLNEDFDKRYLDKTIDDYNKIIVAILYLKNSNEKVAAKLFDTIELDNIRFDRKLLAEILYNKLAYWLTPPTSIKKREMYKQYIRINCQKYQFDCILKDFEEKKKSQKVKSVMAELV